jgi:hypothetical protein
MTDKEISKQTLEAGLESDNPYIRQLAANAVRDALEQPEQAEPLEYWNAVEGWVKIDEVREHFDSVGCGTIYKTAGENRVPLYTAPPQRPWQGLTDEEVAIASAEFDTRLKLAFHSGMYKAQIILRKKNDPTY